MTIKHSTLGVCSTPHGAPSFYDRSGGPEVVHLSTFALPDPQPDEVIVRVKAGPINPIDWKIRGGDTKIVTGSKFPRAMGTDFSGYF